MLVSMYLPAIRKEAFTLIELLVVVAIIGMILAIALPNFLKYRTYAQTQLCIENLSQIEAAKQQWGLETKKNTGDEPAVSDLVGPDKWIKSYPECPSGGSYTYQPIGTDATCTISGHSL